MAAWCSNWSNAEVSREPRARALEILRLKSGVMMKYAAVIDGCSARFMPLIPSIRWLVTWGRKEATRCATSPVEMWSYGSWPSGNMRKSADELCCA